MDRKEPISNAQQHLITPKTDLKYKEDEVGLRELFYILWAGKWAITCSAVVAALISVIVAMTMIEIYRAETILSPVEQERAGGGLASQLGGAAALLGVDVVTGGTDKVSTAIAVLKSREFIRKFIEKHDLLVPLFAGRWDKSMQKNVIDSNLYNENTGVWIAEDAKPTWQEAYRKFSGILTVLGPDRDSGLISVSIEWHDPEQAAEWVNQMVIDLNQDTKQRDVAEANNAIGYLREQLVNTALVEMQQVFYQLIQSQTRITMLADVRDEYVFRVIDPAVAPEERVSPMRSLILLIGILTGISLGVIFTLIKAATKR